MSELLENLNDKQREAVVQTTGPVLILAGAGSGKTRALTFRVAHLVCDKKVSPKNILAVTFTNKAAGEMLDRVKELLGLPKETPPFSQYLPHIGTFHSICVRILRKEIEKVGFDKNFVIYDDQDQLAAMKRVMKELEISQEEVKPKAILYAISDAKNKLIDTVDFEEGVGGYFEERVAKCYSRYAKNLKDANALDFDDLIMVTVKIFQQYPEVLEMYQNLFRFIMVDEYQDTNHAQYTLLKLLAKKFRNICVVGDDWQCFPSGTKIETPKGEKSIEKIKKGDELVCAGGRGKSCVQKVVRTKKHNHKGELIEIKTKGGRKIVCTPNHIVFSRLSLREDIFYVYLMYSKKYGYRIGQTKGCRQNKQAGEMEIGLNVRANQERADRMWVLKVAKTKEEAFYWEEFLSLKYQIPTLVFLTKGRNMKLSQEKIDEFYGNVDTRGNAKKFFDDFYLNFDYPHHLPQATIRFDTNRKRLNLTMFFETRISKENPWYSHRISINSTDKELEKSIKKLGISTRKGKNTDWRTEIAKLDLGELEKLSDEIEKSVDGLVIFKKANLTGNKPLLFHPAGQLRETMKIGVFEKGKIVEDEIVSVEDKQHSGAVYDLDVENVHNYVANGAVVHNSIYGWRGADVQNILDFEKDYPDAKVVLLEQNYRSTQNILDAAHQVISKNVRRKDKKLWTDNDAGNLLTLFEAFDEKDEAEFVVAQIDKLQKEFDLKLDDFAILYRTNAQSRALEEVLLKFGVPYKIIGGTKFYQRKEIKDILSYLYFLTNPRDKVSFERIVNMPARGLGEKTVFKVLAVSEHFGGDVLKTIEGLETDMGLNAGKIKVLHEFAKMIRKLQIFSKSNPPSKLIEKVYTLSGYEKMLAKMGDEGEVRHENVLELLTVSNKYDSEKEGLRMFLEEVALVSQVDRDLEEKEMVPLMTMHAAKGLEYDVIFLVGMEEGLFPHSRATLNEKEMEEERRLCYVGITRAKQKAHLIHTQARNIYGSTQVSIRSRFIDEIDSDLFEEMYSERENKWMGPDDESDGGFYDDEEAKTSSEKALPAWTNQGAFQKKKEEFESPAVPKTNFRDGDRVTHPDFGQGIVVSSDDATVSVAFPKVGVKKLSKTVGPLKKV